MANTKKTKPPVTSSIKIAKYRLLYVGEIQTTWNLKRRKNIQLEKVYVKKKNRKGTHTNTQEKERKGTVMDGLWSRSLSLFLFLVHAAFCVQSLPSFLVGIPAIDSFFHLFTRLSMRVFYRNLTTTLRRVTVARACLYWCYIISQRFWWK